jgi:hypothetical protein
VVGAFAASGITFIKLMGAGMIVALPVDATIIRVLLVPATMRLPGQANWWAPRPLRRLHARYGIKEEAEPAAPAPAVAAAAEGDPPHHSYRPNESGFPLSRTPPARAGGGPATACPGLSRQVQ